MKKFAFYILPIAYVFAFVLGIYIIFTCDTGLFTSNVNAAIIAGSIVSVFSGIFLAIFLWNYHEKAN